jgi:hypothetical protein
VEGVQKKSFQIPQLPNTATTTPRMIIATLSSGSTVGLLRERDDGCEAHEIQDEHPGNLDRLLYVHFSTS